MKKSIAKIALILLIVMTIATLGSLGITIVQAMESGISMAVVKEIIDILVGELIVFLLYLGLTRDNSKQ